MTKPALSTTRGRLARDVLATLEASGPIRDEHGRALSHLARLLGKPTTTYLSAVVRALYEAGAVTIRKNRDGTSTKGRRAYEIALAGDPRAGNGGAAVQRVKAEVVRPGGDQRPRPRNPIGAALYDDVETAEIMARIFPKGIPTDDPEQLAQDMRMAGTIRSRMGAAPRGGSRG